MNYWPGTKIIKSKNNAFDWHSGTSKIAADRSTKKTNTSTIQNTKMGTDFRKFTTYSRARIEP